jgi:hypothetical protein
VLRALGPPPKCSLAQTTGPKGHFSVGMATENSINSLKYKK